ncbi:MAG: DUF3298 and DUF4163 domain-containing protein [Clostridiaceae bacterium]|nr:DUF3298 and DUF4163 domain-containing protein [Clostridiaceae bacterium]
MNSSNFSAVIRTVKITRNFTYNNKSMLTLCITYPHITISCNASVQGSINKSIKDQVDAFYNYASNDLYKQAVEAYNEAQQNDFPFNHYDAILEYHITYNGNCLLSLYYDRYEYTGGAHGITVRSSATWKLTNAEPLPVSCFFPAGEDFCGSLIKLITAQADFRLTQTPGIYFEDYQKLIADNFNPCSFYLTAKGIDIYYQQYEIAPYSTGIVIFNFSYKELKCHPSGFKCCSTSGSSGKKP